MTDPVTLTLVRYPPRHLADRRGRRGARVPGRGIAAAAACVLWLPAGFHAALATVGGMRWTADAEAWLLLAALAGGGVPLALACLLLWRRRRVGPACAALAVLAPAAVVGTVAVEGFGLLAVATVAAAASVPAWLACARRRPRGLKYGRATATRRPRRRRHGHTRMYRRGDRGAPARCRGAAPPCS